jgi:hypothetical protein
MAAKITVPGEASPASAAGRQGPRAGRRRRAPSAAGDLPTRACAAYPPSKERPLCATSGRIAPRATIFKRLLILLAPDALPFVRTFRISGTVVGRGSPSGRPTTRRPEGDRAACALACRGPGTGRQDGDPTRSSPTCPARWWSGDHAAAPSESSGFLRPQPKPGEAGKGELIPLLDQRGRTGRSHRLRSRWRSGPAASPQSTKPSNNWSIRTPDIFHNRAH